MWNISGLKSKLDGTCYDVDFCDFIDYLNTFEIFCFVETWADKLNQFSLDGYKCFDSIRIKHATAFRNSGGIAAFVKNSLFDISTVTQLKSVSENILWLKFDFKRAVNMCNYIIGFVYMSPEGSSVYSEENLFQIIENEMAEFKNRYFDHRFIVGGDFNAYTNIYPDFIQFDNTDYLMSEDDYMEDILPPKRCNLDDRDLNSYGQSLLNLCKSTGLKIVNGRFGKDSQTGNFTCITGKSKSVIDYFLVETAVFNYILDFEVGERLESIHMPLGLKLCLCLRTQHSENLLHSNLSVTHPYVKYKYTEEHKSQYIREVSEKLLTESEIIFNLINHSEVNEALEKLMNCITLAAHCMKQAHVNRKIRYNKQPWFDKSCKELRTKTLRALRYFRHTLTENALSAYRFLKNSYRKLTSSKKGDYVANRTAKLNAACNEKNTRTFWNVLKEHKPQPPTSISVEDWFEYFSSLYNIDSQSEEVLPEGNVHEIQDDLLDSPITSAEVFIAIKELKNGKSAGADGVPAELFKVISDKFVPILVPLFNKCLI